MVPRGNIAIPLSKYRELADTRQIFSYLPGETLRWKFVNDRSYTSQRILVIWKSGKTRNSGIATKITQKFSRKLHYFGAPLQRIGLSQWIHLILVNNYFFLATSKCEKITERNTCTVHFLDINVGNHFKRLSYQLSLRIPSTKVEFSETKSKLSAIRWEEKLSMRVHAVFLVIHGTTTLSGILEKNLSYNISQ